jgi:AraC family transcriptional regulator
MAGALLVPDQVPLLVPGELTVRSPDAGWDGPSVRGYRYTREDVKAPPMRDYVIVAYCRGRTSMRRRVDSGSWVDVEVGPGDVSLLPRAAASHWAWGSNIEVVHVYLSADDLTATCREMYEREVQEVGLRDELKAGDLAIYRIAMALAAETVHGGPGSGLLVDSLTQQLCVHLLRQHADVLFRETGGEEGLTFAQERTVRDYIQARLDQTITLEGLAASVALSRYQFARRFRRSTGTSPYEFVLQQRIARAQAMLTHTRSPLHDIAANCGFADQSHMTRAFRKRLGTTPGRYRTQS